VACCLAGFSDFVTSITASIASGWSDPAAGDWLPLEIRQLFTTHAETDYPSTDTDYSSDIDYSSGPAE
jgi:hypothetical protein